jgi:fatty acid desaturase
MGVSITEQLDEETKALIKEAQKKDVAMSTIVILSTLGFTLLALWFGYWSVITGRYLLTIGIMFILGGLQHRIGTIQHDAVHGSLYESRHWNDLIGLSFFGGLVGLRATSSRTVHMSHHGYLGTTKDQESAFYILTFKSPQNFVVWSLKALFLITSCQRILELMIGIVTQRQRKRENGKIQPSASRDIWDWGVVGFVQAGLLLMFSFTCGWQYYFLLWLLPLFTTTRLLISYRTLVEHASRPALLDPDMKYLNTIHCSKLEAFFFGPLGFNFHGEHHLFSQIASWKLAPVAEKLRERNLYRQDMKVYSSYLEGIWSNYLSSHGQHYALQRNLQAR